MITTRQRVENWSRWREYRYGGYGKSIFDRLLDGMPSTKCPACRGHKRRQGGPCPTCNGAGTIKLDQHQREGYQVVKCHNEACLKSDPVTQEMRHDENCFFCRGTGIKVIPVLNVNPAGIRSTYRDSGNPECERIDRLMCEMAQRQRLELYFRVMWTEWCEKSPGITQERRSARLGLNQKLYSQKLQQIMLWVELGLSQAKEPPSALRFPSYEDVCIKLRIQKAENQPHKEMAAV